MASRFGHAPSMRGWRLKEGGGRVAGRVGAWAAVSVENWLEAERDQLVLWCPVALACGIAAWFLLPDAGAWRVFLPKKIHPFKTLNL